MLAVGEVAIAEDELQRVVSARPDFREAISNLGVVKIALGKFADAAAIFRHLLQMGADDPTLHFNLGLALQGLDERAEAVAEFERAIDPADPTSERSTHARTAIDSMLAPARSVDGEWRPVTTGRAG